MGFGKIRRTVTLIIALGGKYASSAEITWAFSFLLSKKTLHSHFPEHTHRMNRQVKRSVSVQYLSNRSE